MAWRCWITDDMTRELESSTVVHEWHPPRETLHRHASTVVLLRHNVAFSRPPSVPIDVS